MTVLEHQVQYIPKSSGYSKIEGMEGVIIELPDHLMVVGSKGPFQELESFPFDYAKIFFAGVSSLGLPDGSYAVNMALSLNDYFQNIRNYQVLKRNKKIKHLLDRRVIRKQYQITNLHFYPSIYVMARHLSSKSGQKQIKACKFGEKCFEAIIYDDEMPVEGMFYTLAKGYGNFAEVAYDSDMPSIPNDDMESYFSSTVNKKLDMLKHRDNKNSPIYISFERYMDKQKKCDILLKLKKTTNFEVIENVEELIGQEMLNFKDNYQQQQSIAVVVNNKYSLFFTK